MTGRSLTRRALCLGLSAGLLAHAPQAFADEAAPGRVAALGWVPAQTALALGVAPVFAPEIALYDRLVVEPAMPPGTLDAGLRSEPNLERLVMLRPDLILTDESLSGNAHRLSRIAPIFAMETRRRDMGPLQAARLAMRALADRLDRSALGRAYEDRLDAMLEETAARLRSRPVEPLYLVGELPATRALVFGRGSLYQDILDRLGLVNAWDGPTTAWGHATVSPDALSRPGARMVFVSSRLPDVADLVRRRPLWQALPFVREDRITIIPDVLFYGGLPSALRFTRLLGEAFGGGDAPSRA